MPYSINRQCLEKILTRLTNLIVINESDTKELKKYVEMATIISAQLTGVMQVEAGIEIIENDE